MAETTAQTLAPEKKSADVITALPSQSRTDTIHHEKEALFDSLSQERMGEDDLSESTPMKTLLAGMLWFGYAVAIVVAIVLVWSAASGLVKAF